MIETAALSGRDVLDLFQEKLSKAETCGLCLKNFCDYNGEKWFGQRNPYLEGCYKEMADMMLEAGKKLAKPEFMSP
jgi:hypothetical protein